MSTIVNEVKENGIILRAMVDESPSNPREDDNLGTMVCWSNRHSLGDDHDFDSAVDMWEHLATESGCDVEEGEGITDEQKAVVLTKYLVLPLYLYDHSGITISTTPFSCRWDSGQVGFVYVSHEDIEKEYGVVDNDSVAKAREVILGEVKTYDQYISGDVYGFELVKEIECECCGITHEEEIASCWGFYGGDWSTNGMSEHIPEEHRGLLERL